MTTFPDGTLSPAPWRRALVTGGAGFLGSHVCERLLASGVDVDCLDNLSTGHADNIGRLTGRPGFRFLEYDLADPACPNALAGPYDLVLHLAGPASPTDGLERPVEVLDAAGRGTRNALAVADRHGARFLLASAPADDGDSPLAAPPPAPGDAADPLAPRTAYVEAQRFSEALVAAHAGARGSNAGIVRLFAVHGPRMRTDDGRMIPVFVRQALAGEPVAVTGDGSRPCSLCYVDDAVDGMLLVAAGRSVRPVDLGSDEETTDGEVARRVIELTGSRSPLVYVAPPAAPAAPCDERPRPATGFAHELFGWSPRVPWEEGLERTVAALTGGSGRTPAVVTGHDDEWPP
ncbi:NAD-dependent epimerase/dehydratase family protein [Streptomyces sp. NPDC052012]|uniref:NAD-dependent epimerase/dehydratase family protein n=1 Tax=Streptomyces sp. NPDC052012 TaxID=3155051 RepID=UPI00344B99F2